MIKSAIRIVLSYFLIFGQTIAYAQTTAAILPQGKTQFSDNNGKPLTSGTVDFYIPSTTTRKTTWQNSGKSIANANPVVLDAGGRAIIYGDGTYRQVVKDRAGNLIYDAVTASIGTGGSTTGTGDGDLVGTIKPWAGLVAPNQYAFAYGQEISRTTYSVLFTAITLTQPVTCASGSPILTGLSDTSQIPTGAVLETICAPAGSTVSSKTSTTITLNNNATLTTVTTAVIFLYGNGNGSTTFNLPDLRGYTIAGRTNMGGVASNNLTSTYFGSNPQSTGGKGGSQFNILFTTNLPPYTPAGTISSITPAGTISQITPAGTISSITPAGTISSITPAGTISTPTISQITPAGTISQITPAGTNASSSLTGGTTAAISTFPTGAGGGGTTFLTTAATGSTTTYGVTGTAAAQTFTGTPVTPTFTGTPVTPTSSTPTFTGTLTTPTFTGTPATPTFTGTPVTPTFTGTLTTPTFSGTAQGGASTGFSLVQPTQTLNYIIKITPDSNSADASGVTSIQGMTGDIACGTGLTCTGNTMSVNIGTGVTSIGGVSGAITFSGGSGLSMTGHALTPYVYQGSGSVTLNVDHTLGTDVYGCGFSTGAAACRTIYYAYNLFQTSVKIGPVGSAIIQSDCNFTENPPQAFLGNIHTGNGVAFIIGFEASPNLCTWTTTGLHVDDGAVVSFRGWSTINTGATSWLSLEKAGTAVAANMLWGPAVNGAHLSIYESTTFAYDGGTYQVGITVGGCAPNCFNYHIINNGGHLELSNQTINVPQVMACNAWYGASGAGSRWDASALLFTGAGGAGGACQPYNLSEGAQVRLNGVALPGGTLGTVSTNACLDGKCVNIERPNTFATLPTCNNIYTGYMASITDSNTAAWGAVAAGGGGNPVVVKCSPTGNYTVVALDN